MFFFYVTMVSFGVASCNNFTQLFHMDPRPWNELNADEKAERWRVYDQTYEAYDAPTPCLQLDGTTKVQNLRLFRRKIQPVCDFQPYIPLWQRDRSMNLLDRQRTLRTPANETPENKNPVYYDPSLSDADLDRFYTAPEKPLDALEEEEKPKERRFPPWHREGMCIWCGEFH